MFQCSEVGPWPAGSMLTLFSSTMSWCQESLGVYSVSKLASCLKKNHPNYQVDDPGIILIKGNGGKARYIDGCLRLIKLKNLFCQYES